MEPVDQAGCRFSGTGRPAFAALLPDLTVRDAGTLGSVDPTLLAYLAGAEAEPAPAIEAWVWGLGRWGTRALIAAVAEAAAVAHDVWARPPNDDGLPADLIADPSPAAIVGAIRAVAARHDIAARVALRRILFPLLALVARSERWIDESSGASAVIAERERRLQALVALRDAGNAAAWVPGIAEIEADGDRVEAAARAAAGPAFDAAQAVLGAQLVAEIPAAALLGRIARAIRTLLCTDDASAPLDSHAADPALAREEQLWLATIEARAGTRSERQTELLAWPSGDRAEALRTLLAWSAHRYIPEALMSALVRATDPDLPPDIMDAIWDRRATGPAAIIIGRWGGRGRTPVEIAWLLRGALGAGPIDLDYADVVDAHPDVDWSAVATALPDDTLLRLRASIAHTSHRAIDDILHAECARRPGAPEDRVAHAFSQPTEEALAELARHAPLVEIGAGTGYWAHLLRERGVDIVAYDRDPPDGTLRNRYFAGAVAWTEVLEGDETALPAHSDRALLLLDPEPGPMAAACLASYGGQVVIYGGNCLDHEARMIEPFWSNLERDYRRVARHELPDDSLWQGRLEVWRRKRS
jgi:hypothetical protein